MGSTQSQPQQFVSVPSQIEQKDLVDGGEPPFASGFIGITAIAVDAQNNVFVADGLCNRVCRIRPERPGSTALVNEVFASGKNATRPTSPDQMWHGIYDVQSLAVGNNGALYASNHHAISEIDVKTGASRIIAGAQVCYMFLPSLLSHKLCAGRRVCQRRRRGFSLLLAARYDCRRIRHDFRRRPRLAIDSATRSARFGVPLSLLFATSSASAGVKLTEVLQECTRLPPPLLRIIGSYSDRCARVSSSNRFTRRDSQGRLTCSLASAPGGRAAASKTAKRKTRCSMAQ